MNNHFIMAGIAAAALALAGCDGSKSSDSVVSAPSEPVKAVPAPNGGDWSTIVAVTPEGGFVMGNPKAGVKLVEFGSMTCPHCREFDEAAMKPLTDKYVKSGRVSFEFRNYVRDPYDMAASVVARCAGPGGFFGLTRQLYADQPDWIAKAQSADPAKLQALSTLPPAEQLAEVARLAGFPEYAAMRGIPSAKLNACLADTNTPTRLVQLRSDIETAFPNIPGTPSFLINGKMIDIKPGTPVWTQVEGAIKTAIGG